MISLTKCKYRKFCRDDVSKIENYQDAINSTEQYVLHHRLELTLDGEFAHTAEDLKRLGMYYNRPYFELIFLPQSEHLRLHNNIRKGENHPFYSKHHSEEARRQMSESHKGKPLSAEHRQKLSEHSPYKGKCRPKDTRKKISKVINERWNSYWQYKSNGGTMKWNEFQRSISTVI